MCLGSDQLELIPPRQSGSQLNTPEEVPPWVDWPHLTTSEEVTLWLCANIHDMNLITSHWNAYQTIPYGTTSLGAKEDTDRLDCNQESTLRIVPAKTLEEAEQDQSRPMDAQAIFGNRAGLQFLGFSKWYHSSTYTPGRPYDMVRPSSFWSPAKAGIDRKLFAAFISDFIRGTNMATDADTVVIVADNRPLSQLLKDEPFLKPCAERMLLRSRIVIKERTKITYLHVHDQSGIDKLHPCYYTPIIIAALRAQEGLSHIHFVGSDLDIFLNGAVDVQQHLEFLLPVVRERYRTGEESKVGIGMYWFSEVRLKHNAGRLIAPATSNEKRDKAGHIDDFTAEVVGRAMDAARAQAWGDRFSLQELQDLLTQQVDKSVVPAILATRISFSRALGKSPVRDAAPSTPAALWSLFAALCEGVSALCFPFLGGWDFQSMRVVDLSFLEPGLRDKATSQMFGWGKAPYEQALLEIMAQVSMPACKAMVAPGPALFMDLARPVEESARVVPAETSHAYGSNEQGQNTKAFLQTYDVNKPFDKFSDILFGTEDRLPAMFREDGQITCGLALRGVPPASWADGSPVTHVVVDVNSFGMDLLVEGIQDPQLAVGGPTQPDSIPIMSLTFHGLSPDTNLPGPAVIHNQNRYNGGLLYGDSGEVTTPADSVYTSLDNVVQGLALLFQSRALHESFVKDADRVGVSDTGFLKQVLDMKLASIAPYLYFGNFEVAIALKRVAMILKNVTKKLVVYGFSAGANNAFAFEGAWAALKAEPVRIQIGAWEGSYRGLLCPRALESTDRRVCLVLAAVDRLCNTANEGQTDEARAALGMLCSDHGIKLTILEDDSAIQKADPLGYLGRNGHGFSYLVMRPEIWNLPEVAKLSSLGQLGIPPFINQRKKFAFFVLAYLITKNQEKVPLEALLPVGWTDRQELDRPARSLPPEWQCCVESDEAEVNFNGIKDIITVDWETLGPIQKDLFRDRIAPEISAEVLDASVLCELKDEHPQVKCNIDYLVSGPQAFTLSIHVEEVSPWAVFSVPDQRNDTKIGSEVGFKQWEYCEVTLRIHREGFGEHLEEFSEQERVGDFLSNEGSGAEAVDVKLKGIVGASWTFDAKEREPHVGSDFPFPFVKFLELLVYWPNPLLTSGTHKSFHHLASSGCSVQIVSLSKTKQTVAQYWFGLLRNLTDHNAEALRGFPVKMDAEEKGMPDENQRTKGNFRYIVANYVPRNPLPYAPHRASEAYHKFYNLILQAAGSGRCPEELSSVLHGRMDPNKVLEHIASLSLAQRSQYQQLGEITSPALFDVFHHLFWLFVCGKPIGYITGLGGAGKSYALGVALILFTTWANLTYLGDAPLRVLVTGPRLASLQTWTEQLTELCPEQKHPNVYLDLLEKTNTKFMRVPPNQKGEDEVSGDSKRTKRAGQVEAIKIDYDHDTRTRQLKKIASNDKLGPWMVFMSTGTAKGLLADAGRFPGWLESIDVLVVEEGQQAGYAESIGVQAVMPKETLVLYNGDGQQTPHIGNQNLRGSRQATAHLEASLATLRGSVTPLPPEELLRIQIEAISQFLTQQEKHDLDNAKGLQRQLVERRLLFSQLQDPRIREIVSATLHDKLEGHEPAILLYRSQRLYFGPFAGYVIAEQYRKVIYQPSSPMKVPSLHPAYDKRWSSFTIGGVSLEQCKKKPLLDPFGARQWDVQTFVIDNQLMQQAGIQMVASKTGGRHVHLEITAEYAVRLLWYRLAMTADRVTQEQPFCILTTHHKFKEVFLGLVFGGPGVVFRAQGSKREDKPPVLVEAEEFQRGVSLFQVIQDKFPEEYEATVNGRYDKTYQLMYLFSVLHKAGRLQSVIRAFIWVNLGLMTTGATLGDGLVLLWINNVFASKASTCNVILSRFSKSMAVLMTNYGLFGLLRRYYNHMMMVEASLFGHLVHVDTLPIVPTRGPDVSQDEENPQGNTVASANQKFEIVPPAEEAIKQWADDKMDDDFWKLTGEQGIVDMKWEWAAANPHGDVSFQQNFLHSHYQASQMKCWGESPNGVALWFSMNGSERQDVGLFVQDAFYQRPLPPANVQVGAPVLEAAGKVVMMYTRVEHLTNRIFRHREYSAGKNSDWMIKIKVVDHGKASLHVYVEARHREFGATQWKLDARQAATGAPLYVARELDEGRAIKLMLSLPYPGDVLEGRITEGHWPFPEELGDSFPGTIQTKLVWNNGWLKELEEPLQQHDEDDDYQEDNKVVDGDFAAFSIADTDLQHALKRTYLSVLGHYANGLNPIVPCIDEVIDPMLSLKWEQPLVVSIEITRLLANARRLALLQNFEMLHGMDEAPQLRLSLQLVTAVVDQIAMVVFSVTKLINWELALGGRYDANVLPDSDAEDLRTTIPTYIFWRKQVLLAIRGTTDNKGAKEQRLVHIKPEKPKSRGDPKQIICGGEMHLKILIPAEAALCLQHRWVAGTVNASQQLRAQCTVAANVDNNGTPVPAGVAHPRYLAVHVDGNLKPSDTTPVVAGTLAGIIRDTSTTKASAGMHAIIATPPNALPGYEDALVVLRQVASKRIGSGTAVHFLLKNEAWTPCKIHFPRLSGNAADPTPGALFTAKEFEGSVEDHYVEWLGAAFTIHRTIVKPFIDEVRLVKNAPVHRGAVELVGHDLVPAYHINYATMFATRFTPPVRKRTAADGDHKGKGQQTKGAAGKKGHGEGKKAASPASGSSWQAVETGSGKRAGSNDPSHAQAKERRIEPSDSSSSNKGKGRGKGSQGKAS